MPLPVCASALVVLPYSQPQCECVCHSAAKKWALPERATTTTINIITAETQAPELGWERELSKQQKVEEAKKCLRQK